MVPPSVCHSAISTVLRAIAQADSSAASAWTAGGNSLDPMFAQCRGTGKTLSSHLRMTCARALRTVGGERGLLRRTKRHPAMAQIHIQRAFRDVELLGNGPDAECALAVERFGRERRRLRRL